jgi:hypothetical protein
MLGLRYLLCAFLLLSSATLHAQTAILAGPDCSTPEVSGWLDFFADDSNSPLNSYPKLFSSSTFLSLSVPNTSYIRLSLCDHFGRPVATPIDDQRNPVIHRVALYGSDLPSGTYFFLMETQGVTIVEKTILLK